MLVADGKNPKIGTPHVAKASVSGEVVSQDKKDKYAIQFRRRKDSRELLDIEEKLLQLI